MTLQMSEQIGEFAKAFAAFQAEIENIKKDGKNPHFKSTYAKLPDILEAVRPVLSRHGLSMLQIPGNLNDSILVETILLHTSGQWIKGDFYLTPKDKYPQAYGSAVSYGKRYMAEGMLALGGKDDDDAETANGRPAIPREAEIPPNQTQVALNKPALEIFNHRNEKHFKWAFKFCERMGKPEVAMDFMKQLDGKPCNLETIKAEWDLFSMNQITSRTEEF